VSQSSGYIASVLPIILCAPKYLDRSLTLGQVMQAASAVTIVQVAFNWLVDNYPRLADWTASARRVDAAPFIATIPYAAHAQGTIQGVEKGAAAGERAAGALGAIVGGAVAASWASKSGRGFVMSMSAISFAMRSACCCDRPERAAVSASRRRGALITLLMTLT
jgi:hypothetical protein